jgi:GntR family transcriptional regulator
VIDPDLPVPLYEQLAAVLREKITSGELTGRVPSIVTLAQEHGVSHRTSARALRMLADEGLIVALHGKGFYVRR